MPLIKERAATIHGLSYCLAKGSKNKEQAIDFLAFLGSKEANEIWAEKATVIPANNNVLETWEKSYPDKNLKAFTQMVEYSVPYPVSSNTPVWNELESNAINEMYSYERPVREVLKDLADKMNEALAKEQK